MKKRYLGVIAASLLAVAPATYCAINVNTVNAQEINDGSTQDKVIQLTYSFDKDMATNIKWRKDLTADDVLVYMTDHIHFYANNKLMNEPKVSVDGESHADLSVAVLFTCNCCEKSQSCIIRKLI